MAICCIITHQNQGNIISEYHQSEQPAIELFKKMNYDYFDAKKAMSGVVLYDRLERKLSKEIMNMLVKTYA